MRRPASAPVLALALASVGLAGCSSWLPGGDPIARWVPAWRMDIQQGNVVTREQLERVKPGMTRLQVRDILGTPMVADPFHRDRWDYIFTFDQPRQPMQRRSVVLIFDGDKLRDIEAGELPSEREFVTFIAGPPRPFKGPALELTPAQIQALPAPPRAASAPAEAPVGPARVYPPLEPS